MQVLKLTRFLLTFTVIEKARHIYVGTVVFSREEGDFFLNFFERGVGGIFQIFAKRGVFELRKKHF